MIWHRYKGIILAIIGGGISSCGVANLSFNRTLSLNELDKVAREITVIIDGCGVGSGILYKREGNAYKVLTANHVISDETQTCLITTPDGKEYNALQQITRPIEGLDIAILQFDSRGAEYKIADLGDSTQIKESEPIYVAGAPGIKEGTPKRVMQANQGNLLPDAIKSSFEGLEYLIFFYSNAIPGMSGGSVLNSQGELVGVIFMGSFKANSNFNLSGAIPIHTLDPKKYPAQSVDEVSKVFYNALRVNSESNPDKAIEQYTRAIQLKPDNALLYYSRGLVLSFTQRENEALDDFNQAIKLDPKFALVYGERGLIYLNKGDKDKALDDFNQAISLDPKFTGTYVKRGLIYFEKKETDKALDDFNQAISLDPKFSDAYLGRGNCYYARGEKDKALADFNKAISLNSQVAIVYHWRGIIYLDRGESDKALADFNQAINLNPKSAFTYVVRGIIYADKGEKEKELADFRKAVEISRQLGDKNQESQILNIIKEIEKIK